MDWYIIIGAWFATIVSAKGEQKSVVMLGATLMLLLIIILYIILHLLVKI